MSADPDNEDHILAAQLLDWYPGVLGHELLEDSAAKIADYRNDCIKAERNRVLDAVAKFVEEEKAEFESGTYYGVLVDAGDLVEFISTLRSEP